MDLVKRVIILQPPPNMIDKIYKTLKIKLLFKLTKQLHLLFLDVYAMFVIGTSVTRDWSQK